MKKFIALFIAVVIIVGVALCLPKTEEYEYLRLHIRANSNSVVDQNIKYEIKDVMVNFLTPYLCDVKSKDEAESIIKELTPYIEDKCINVLKSNGFNYSVKVCLRNEYFPTRTYNNTTLDSGYYDAVIVELGEAEGDNWWCVMYPPLCFVNKNENTMQIKYKSKIVEWFKSLFD